MDYFVYNQGVINQQGYLSEAVRCSLDINKATTGHLKSNKKPLEELKDETEETNMKLENILSIISATETISIFVEQELKLIGKPGVSRYNNLIYYGACCDFRATTKSRYLLERDVEKVEVYNGTLSIWLA